MPESSRKMLCLAWSAIGAAALLVMLWSYAAGFTFPLLHFLNLAIAAAGLQVCAFLVNIARVRDGHAAFMLLQSIALILTGSIVFEMAMYLGNALALPLVDPSLIAFDRALGFDWRSFYGWVTQHPFVMMTLRIAYSAFLPELVFLVWLLALTRHIPALERLVVAYFITLGATIIIATLWPAVAAYIFYDIHPGGLAGYLPSARVHEHDVLALRSGELRHFPMIMEGLVTFPSFHATAAVLYLWASWPLRWWRPISLIVNPLMIVASLSSGGHWLADVIGGIAVAIAGIYATRALLPKITASAADR